MVKQKESLLYVILVIAGLSIIGWFSGNMDFASYSLSYVPIAPANLVILIPICIISIFKLRFEKSKFSESYSTVLLLIIAVFCLIILIHYFFKFFVDIEDIIFKNAESHGNLITGRISPISCLLFILVCVAVHGLSESRSVKIKYIGGTVSLLVLIISSILLIGYLYKAPLLYGSNIIPVSLPSAICFFLFSVTFLRVYEFKFYTFSLIKANKVTRLLLKFFLPVVVFIVVLQGFLDTVFSFNDINPPLTGAIILLIFICITTYIIYKVSDIIGVQLLAAEKQLKDSEERSRSIMENSADAIFLTDMQGNYIYTNKTASDLLGFSSEELLGKSFVDISPPDKVADYIEVFKRLLDSHKILMEIELLKKDGNYLPADLNAVLLPDGIIYGSCRDITERKQSEKALKESENRLRTVADYNYDWEFWLGPDEKFIYNSPSCERISGYTPEDFAKNPNLISQIIHPDDLLIYENHLAPDNVDKVCTGIDYRITTAKGEIRWINHVCQPVFDDRGKNIGRRGSNSDITDRKNAENKVNDLNRKLSELNINKDRFIAILGHDLKSPFNNLLGLSDVLTEDVHKLNIDQIQEIAVTINSAARTTYKLLEEILLWARTQQGKIPFKPQTLRLKEICRDVIEVLYPAANSKNISITYTAPSDSVVFADSDMLKTIIRNLVSNAIKFTQPGGLIKISSERTYGNQVISVSDNGIGIEPENLSKLFDISQIITTNGTAGESGTGLGLLLCKEFVEKHNGKIWAESSAGKGSDFKFYFKVTDPIVTKSN